MSNEKHEMEVLLAEKEVKLGNKSYVIKRFSLLDTLRLAAEMSKVVSKMMSDSENFSNAISRAIYSSGDKNADLIIKTSGILEFIAMCGDDGIDFIKNTVKRATGMSEEEAEAIDAVEGIDLIFDIYEVNKDFFKKCLTKLGEKIPKAASEEKKTKKE